MNYRTYLDTEVLGFVDRMNGFYPPDSLNLPIAENRRIYDQMSEVFREAPPVNVASRTFSLEGPEGGLPVRLYQREDPDDRVAILYFHGGGFVLGGLESHDDICAETCARTGFQVLAVDYRLAPEHAHPAAFEDACIAFEWLSRTARKPVVLIGESAGGNLAACLAHHARSLACPPIGQVLVYPSLCGPGKVGSRVTHAHAPLLAEADLDVYLRLRTNGSSDYSDPRLIPYADPDFSGLPPTVVFTAECDPLSSDGDLYCARIRDEGGQAVWVEEKGLVHGYFRGRTQSSRARDSFDRVMKAVLNLVPSP
ncbi:alpha/beta hydrolase [Nisaea sp.]|uniref:alpha/beta hydrolase n=1 Tax=Nisaea sp. TaxID=2024842 RepID=UPI00329A73E4